MRTSWLTNFALVTALALAGKVAGAAGLPTIETAAKQAYIIDLANDTVLLDKRSNEPMPPASMAKLMTMYLVFDHLKQGRMKLTDELPVSERAWRMDGSKMFVHVGTRVKVEDLVRGVIVQSGNDACVVFAEAIAGSEEAFAQLMTAKGKEIGLTGSIFTNSSGWPDPRMLVTARDLAYLGRRIVTDFPDYYRYYSELDYTYNGIKQGNRNPLLYKNLGADGLKTGHTESSGYGLTASAQQQGRRVVLVVNGLASMNQRAQEAERLMSWAFREFDSVELFKPDEPLEQAAVWLGEKSNIALTLEAPLSVTLPRAKRGEISVQVSYDGPLPAPVVKGQRVGTLRVRVPDMAVVERPLVAAESVARKGFLGRAYAAARYFVLGP